MMLTMRSLNLEALDETLANARQALLDARNAAGHWEGELSSSALSTATAVFALSSYGRARLLPSRSSPDMNAPGSAGASPSQEDELNPLIARGLEWLVKNQNTDGGWGDTIKSISNISTTALCWAAFAAGNFPAVSFLKAPAYQDGHAGYSSPLDEQAFIVHVINFLQAQTGWEDTAAVIAYDDSDGWYDHQMGPIVNTSTGPADALTGPNACGAAATSLPGVNTTANPHALGRCGYGMRQPLLVISPWAKQNFVDHSLTDLSSIIHFVEDNWLGGQRIGQGSFDAIAGPINQMFNFSKIRSNGKLCLDPNTGEPSPKSCK